MFISRSTRNKLIDKVCKLETKVEALEDRRLTPKTVTCEKCGCLVLLEEATASEPTVKTKKVYNFYFGSHIEEEYIHRDYFCKLHAPKGKK